MSRLTKLERDAVAPEAQAIYDGVQKARGNVPNMFKTMAHRPKILTTMAAHFKAVMEPTTVTLRLKELVALRVSGINQCDYCMASHSKLAKGAGASDAEVAAAKSGALDVFGGRDKAALRFAEALTLRSKTVREEEFEELKRQFEEGEIVEIAAVAAIFNYFNRFNNALDIEITK